MREREPNTPYRVALLPGDGIGPEVVGAAKRVIDAIGGVETTEYPIGGESIKEFGTPLSDEVLAVCEDSDAILLGAVGGSQPQADPGMRPEAALLRLRSELDLFANLRPAKQWSRRRSKGKGIDLMIVRELAGGPYYGVSEEWPDYASVTYAYSKEEVERIAHIAFQVARSRKGRSSRPPLVTSVDKANVLPPSRLWRSVVSEVAEEYPDVICNHMLVDNAAFQLADKPEQFDVILTDNLMGDILSDEAAGIVNHTLGLAPSASLGAERPGLFEPVHGSAPEIAGRGEANPLATFLSVAMMLRELGGEERAVAVERAVGTVLAKQFRTRDMVRSGDEPKYKVIGTEEMTDEVIKELTGNETPEC